MNTNSDVIVTVSQQPLITEIMKFKVCRCPLARSESVVNNLFKPQANAYRAYKCQMLTGLSQGQSAIEQGQATSNALGKNSAKEIRAN